VEGVVGEFGWLIFGSGGGRGGAAGGEGAVMRSGWSVREGAGVR